MLRGKMHLKKFIKVFYSTYSEILKIMSLKKFIFSLSLSVILMLNMSGTALAQEENLTEPEKVCADKKPDYKKLLEAWQKAEMKDQNAYKDAFEVAQELHHGYVGCMFEFAQNTLLKSDGNEQGGTIDSHLLNTGAIPVVGGLIDWMIPDQACLSSDELKDIIQKSEPNQMLGPILQEQTDYKNYLQTLGAAFDTEGVTTNDQNQNLSQLNQLAAKQTQIQTLKRQREQEIESSMIAIDLMFSSLKELRLSLVIHVHFQCTLQFLEKYRGVLEDLRNVIEPLPDQLQDASVSK